MSPCVCVYPVSPHGTCVMSVPKVSLPKGSCSGHWSGLKPLLCHWVLLLLCQCLPVVSCFAYRNRRFWAEAVYSLCVRTVQRISASIND